LLMALVVEWSWAGRLDGSGGRLGGAVRFGSDLELSAHDLSQIVVQL